MVENLINFLDLIKKDCNTNLKILPNGRCYSPTCIMNKHSELKDIINRQGCECFNMLYSTVEHREQD